MNNAIIDGKIELTEEERRKELTALRRTHTALRRKVNFQPLDPNEFTLSEVRKYNEESPSEESTEEPSQEEEEGSTTGSGKDSCGMYDDEIEAYFSTKCPQKFKGIYICDTVNDALKKIRRGTNGGIILSTDKSSGPGEHWVAVYYDARKVMRYVHCAGWHNHSPLSSPLSEHSLLLQYQPLAVDGAVYSRQ